MVLFLYMCELSITFGVTFYLSLINLEMYKLQILLKKWFWIAAQLEEIETESNATIESDVEVEQMTDNQRTKKLYSHRASQQPVGVMGNVPTMDDVRAIIRADFSRADELWRLSAPKKVMSR